MQHEVNSLHHRLSKFSSRCLFSSLFLSPFFHVIFLPYVSELYYSTVSYLLSFPSLFVIFFLSRFPLFLNYHHYLSLLFIFLFLMLILLLLLLFHFTPFIFYFSLLSLLLLLSTLRVFISHFFHFCLVFIFFFLFSSPFLSI